MIIWRTMDLSNILKYTDRLFPAGKLKDQFAFAARKQGYPSLHAFVTEMKLSPSNRGRLDYAQAHLKQLENGENPDLAAKIRDVLYEASQKTLDSLDSDSILTVLAYSGFFRMNGTSLRTIQDDHGTWHDCYDPQTIGSDTFGLHNHADFTGALVGSPAFVINASVALKFGFEVEHSSQGLDVNRDRRYISLNGLRRSKSAKSADLAPGSPPPGEVADKYPWALAKRIGCINKETRADSNMIREAKCLDLAGVSPGLSFHSESAKSADLAPRSSPLIDLADKDALAKRIGCINRETRAESNMIREAKCLDLAGVSHENQFQTLLSNIESNQCIDASSQNALTVHIENHDPDSERDVDSSGRSFLMSADDIQTVLACGGDHLADTDPKLFSSITDFAQNEMGAFPAGQTEKFSKYGKGSFMNNRSEGIMSLQHSGRIGRPPDGKTISKFVSECRAEGVTAASNLPPASVSDQAKMDKARSPRGQHAGGDFCGGKDPQARIRDFQENQRRSGKFHDPNTIRAGNAKAVLDKLTSSNPFAILSESEGGGDCTDTSGSISVSEGETTDHDGDSGCDSNSGGSVFLSDTETHPNG